MGLLLPERSDVAIERSTEYFVLSIGCIARRAFFTAFGVTARFTARPGCMARRTLRGTKSRVKKPITNHPTKAFLAPTQGPIRTRDSSEADQADAV